MDLAGPFPPDEEGNRYLIVAVDCLSKWVEAAPLPSKHAFRCAEWLYREVFARWGKPDWVRTDNGAEWEGAFSELLQHWGVKHNKITVGNSKANGQVERTIRTIKDVLRKSMAADDDSYWSDHVAAALITLRHSLARSHGYPPFTIITGLIPVLPSDLTEVPPPPAPPEGKVTAQQERDYAEGVARTVREVRRIAKLRLARSELRLRQRLRRMEGQAEEPLTLFHFGVGDKVLQRQKTISKLAAKAEGPFLVVRVGGNYRQRITIQPLESLVGPKRRR